MRPRSPRRRPYIVSASLTLRPRNDSRVRLKTQNVRIIRLLGKFEVIAFLFRSPKRLRGCVLPDGFRMKPPGAVGSDYDVGLLGDLFRRRWNKKNNTTKKQTPATTRTIVMLSILFSFDPAGRPAAFVLGASFDTSSLHCNSASLTGSPAVKRNQGFTSRRRNRCTPSGTRQ
jgi:hypothetical protein